MHTLLGPSATADAVRLLRCKLFICGGRSADHGHGVPLPLRMLSSTGCAPGSLNHVSTVSSSAPWGRLPQSPQASFLCTEPGWGLAEEHLLHWYVIVHLYVCLYCHIVSFSGWEPFCLSHHPCLLVPSTGPSELQLMTPGRGPVCVQWLREPVHALASPSTCSQSSLPWMLPGHYSPSRLTLSCLQNPSW